MDGWNTTFLLGRPIFRCELLVSGRVHPRRLTNRTLESLIFLPVGQCILRFFRRSSSEGFQEKFFLYFAIVDFSFGETSSVISLFFVEHLHFSGQNVGS